MISRCAFVSMLSNRCLAPRISTSYNHNLAILHAMHRGQSVRGPVDRADLSR